MKKLLLMTLLLFFVGTTQSYASEQHYEAFDRFLAEFDYETRADMKIDSKRLIRLLTEKKAVLVDIRFTEEVAAWRMGFGMFISLNDLPKRYHELPKDKIIVVACPHKDRSSIAMAYLRSKGLNARYLSDSLIGLIENLRGDSAADFMEEIYTIPER